RFGLGDRNVESFFLDGRGSRLLGGGLRGHEFFVGNSRGALEAAAKFAETLGAGRFAPFLVNLFELRSKFCGAAIVSRAKNEIEKFFEGRRMARSATENCFKQADRFLRQAVAGKEIDVGKRLRDEFLRFFVDGIFHERRNGSSAGSASCDS